MRAACADTRIIIHSGISGEMFPIPIDNVESELTEEQLNWLDRALEQEAQDNQFSLIIMKNKRTWRNKSRVNGLLKVQLSWTENRL